MKKIIGILVVTAMAMVFSSAVFAAEGEVTKADNAAPVTVGSEKKPEKFTTKNGKQRKFKQCPPKKGCDCSKKGDNSAAKDGNNRESSGKEDVSTGK